MIKKYKKSKHLDLTWIPCVECKLLCPLEWSDSKDGKARHLACLPEPVEKPKRVKKGAPGENQNALF